MLRESTFHSMKMIRASSSKPPMMLPIRIHSEMGIALPFSTSNTVYRKIHEGKDLENENVTAHSAQNLKITLQSSYLPPNCSRAQSDEVSLLSYEPIRAYYPH